MTITGLIGRHQVSGVLGAGGFATVYLAYDPNLQDEVAIKVLADNLAADPELRERFMQEARVMRQLKTPGLVTVYDTGEHQGAPYFVMEYCIRGTLDQRLAAIDHPLGVADGLALADAINACTSGIHAAGMVHRDLKPSNYLIRHNPHRTTSPPNGILGLDEELVVADFGLAKVIDPGASRLSLAGGTPGYSAPEQFRGDPSVDASADVFAASAMIVAAMSSIQPKPLLAPGDTPFDGQAMDTTGPLAPELARGMSIDKAQRHLNIIEWTAALHRAAGDHRSGDHGTGDHRTGPGLGSGSAPRSDPLHSDPLHSAGQPSIGQWAPDVPSAQQPRLHAEAEATRPSFDEWAPPTRPAQQPDLDAPTRVATASGSTSGRNPRRLLALAAIPLALVVAGGVLVSGVFSSSGPPIVGPSEGSVGDEAVFVVDTDEAATWTVNGTTVAIGRSIAITPTGPGSVAIDVGTEDGSSERTFMAVAPSTIRIEGPGLAPVGQPTRMHVVGATGEEFTWTIGEADFVGQTVDLRPTDTGTITLSVESSSGLSTTRTITAIDQTP